MLEFATQYSDFALFLLRAMVFVIFVTSGWKHLANPAERASSIGYSKSFTLFLGLAELLGGVALLIGVLVPWAALGLSIIMLGAIYKKVFVWKTGFFDASGGGWHYDLMLIAMNLVILTTEGGRFILF